MVPSPVAVCSLIKAHHCTTWGEGGLGGHQEKFGTRPLGCGEIVRSVTAQAEGLD